MDCDIRACYIKPYTVTTISENFSSRLKNILKRDFSPDKPNAVWCSDTLMPITIPAESTATADTALRSNMKKCITEHTPLYS